MALAMLSLCYTCSWSRCKFYFIICARKRPYGAVVDYSMLFLWPMGGTAYRMHMLKTRPWTHTQKKSRNTPCAQVYLYWLRYTPQHQESKVGALRELDRAASFRERQCWNAPEFSFLSRPVQDPVQKKEQKFITFLDWWCFGFRLQKSSARSFLFY